VRTFFGQGGVKFFAILCGRLLRTGALPKDIISELAGLSSHVKHGCCEYQFFKSFGLTRLGNGTQVYRLRGGRSYHDYILTTRQLYNESYAMGV